ncbi:hypothetical protein [Pseudomonas savastanoi]|uniref:hypothetical protein n=1 Tax=Pseudomonas savastanoi TaxID=29438 RepID=UPI000F3CE37D|nr:hypothetical protein [Pseudomonas savastanoi]RML92459.1 hypothetical protein ALQ87_02058 [Pseudomonas savastanoi pv. glycinea]
MSTHPALPERSVFRDTLPSTLQGLKKRARKTRLPHQSHTDALDSVAVKMGYADFHRAEKALNPRNAARAPRSQSHYPVYLSAYWRNTEGKTHSAGCETLEIALPRPLSDIVSRHQARCARNLEAFRMQAPDHLEMVPNASDQARARELLVRAALSLQFMDVCGLRPATSQKHLQALEQLENFPSKDHVSLWIDPETNTWLALDEPYDHVNRASEVKDRLDWLTQNDLHLTKPGWQGLYYPGHATAHLISPSHDLVRRTSKALEGLRPIAVVPSPDQRWNGTSAPYTDRFISPARVESGIARRARPGTTYGFSKGAVEYHREAGYPSLWRPKTPLSQADHKKIGLELQRLMISPMPYKAYQKIRTWCSTLENWMYSEYRGLDRDKGFEDTYYGGKPTAYGSVAQQLAALERVCAIVNGGYDECKPRRDLLKDLHVVRLGIEAQRN